MITQNFYPFASSAFLVIFSCTAKGAGTGISISCPEIVLFHLSQVLTWLLAVSKIFLFGENYSKFSCDAGCFIFSQLHTGFGIAVIFPFSLLDVQLSGFKIISIWNKADRRGSWKIHRSESCCCLRNTKPTFGWGSVWAAGGWESHLAHYPFCIISPDPPVLISIGFRRLKWRYPWSDTRHQVLYLFTSTGSGTWWQQAEN